MFECIYDFLHLWTYTALSYLQAAGLCPTRCPRDCAWASHCSGPSEIHFGPHPEWLGRLGLLQVKPNWATTTLSTHWKHHSTTIGAPECELPWSCICAEITSKPMCDHRPEKATGSSFDWTKQEMRMSGPHLHVCEQHVVIRLKMANCVTHHWMQEGKWTKTVGTQTDMILSMCLVISLVFIGLEYTLDPSPKPMHIHVHVRVLP